VTWPDLDQWALLVLLAYSATGCIFYGLGRKSMRQTRLTADVTIKLELAEDRGRLWDYMVKQQEFSVTQFGISLVGEGALLFAYGQLTGPNDFIRFAVSFLGLSTGLVLWLHSYSARRDAQTIRDILAENSSQLVAAYYQTNRWKKGSHWFKPSTRFMTYATGLVVLMWTTLLIHDLGGLPKNHWPLASWWSGWPVGGTASIVLAFIDVGIVVAALSYLYGDDEKPNELPAASKPPKISPPPNS
jgi:hypothetical protein